MTKIAGWFLLVLGLVLIGWTVARSYYIFTGQAPVPVIFNLEEEQDEARVFESLGDEIGQMIEQTLQEQMKEFIPQDTIVKILNLASWSIFSGIAIFAGSQVAGIGIKLLKSS